MTKKHLYIFGLLLLACSCSHDKTVSYTHVSTDSIPIEILSMRISEWIDSALLYPRDCVMFQDSILVVSENKSPNVFSYFHIPALCKKGDYGSIGDGPDEFVFPRLVTEQYDSLSRITILDGQLIHTLSYKNDCILAKDVSRLPSKIDLVNYILIDNEANMITSSSSEYQLNIYDKQNEEIKYLNIFDNEDFKNYDPFGVCMQIFDAVYASIDEYIVIGYKYWYAIDIYNTKTQEVKHITYDDYNENFRNKSYQSTNEFIRNKRRKLYFTKIIPFKDKFYMISWDGANMGDAVAGISPSIAIVITPDGKPIKRMRFAMPISTIAVDSHGDMRYAIGMSPDDYGIHIYEPAPITVE